MTHQMSCFNFVSCEVITEFHIHKADLTKCKSQAKSSIDCRPPSSQFTTMSAKGKIIKLYTTEASIGSFKLAEEAKTTAIQQATQRQTL